MILGAKWSCLKSKVFCPTLDFAKSEKKGNQTNKQGSISLSRGLRKSPLQQEDTQKLADLHSSIPEMVTCKIKVMAVEQEQTMERYLNVTADISQSQYSAVATQEAPIRLPMLCATEKSLAVEFVKGLIPRLRLCMTTEKDPAPRIALATNEDVEAHESGLGELFDSMEAELAD